MGLLKTLLSRALHIAKEIEFLIKSNYRVRKSHQRIYEQNFFCKKKEKENIDTIENGKIVKIGYMAPIFGPKLRQEFKKFGIKTTFTSGRNLTNLICINKSKLFPNTFPVVFHLQCSIYW